MSGSLLTADQVAQILGVPKTWVYEQSRKGRIPTVALGRYRRYRAEAITAWVERLETEGEGADGQLTNTASDRAFGAGRRRSRHASS